MDGVPWRLPGRSSSRCSNRCPLFIATKLNCAQRLDFLINRKVIAELKAVDRLAPIHEAQLRSYLKWSGCKVRLLVNVNVILLKNGLRRVVHDFPG